MCRGCVNYEGAERIDGILENARKMKRAYALVDRVAVNSRPGSANREINFPSNGIDRYLNVSAVLEDEDWQIVFCFRIRDTPAAPASRMALRGRQRICRALRRGRWRLPNS